MFGWSKKEKNEKKLNQARMELSNLSKKDRGQKLSHLRKKYPNHLGVGGYDFNTELFDYELVFMYLLLSDEYIVEEADLYDNPTKDVVEEDIFVEESSEPFLIVPETVEETVIVEAEPVSNFKYFESPTLNSLGAGGVEFGCFGGGGVGDCGGDD